MKEFILILAFASTFYFVIKQLTMNIALVFEDEEKRKGRK